MVKSMTGFGRAYKEIDGYMITVEIKSVNHRYFEFSCRCPRQYGFIDDKIKSFINSKVARGKIECFVGIEALNTESADVVVNNTLAGAYVKSLKELIDNYGLTQEGLSERVGKKRATIANYLRLLKLPAEIQVGLKDKKIDMGHARALIPVDDPEVQLALYEQILAQGLSVRNVEEMVRNIAEGIQPELPEKKKSDRKPILPEEFKLLKDHLSRYFNTKVQLTCNEKGKGKITIPFATEEELEQLIGLLDKLK